MGPTRFPIPIDSRNTHCALHHPPKAISPKHSQAREQVGLLLTFTTGGFANHLNLHREACIVQLLGDP